MSNTSEGMWREAILTPGKVSYFLSLDQGQGVLCSA